MDPEKIELFKTGGETPVVDTEKDKQEILQNLERELANKKQELADLDSKLGYMPTEELATKKNQLNQDIMGIESQKLTLVQEAAAPQIEIKTEPEKSAGPEAPTDDFKITLETDPDFLKKKFAEQKSDLGPAMTEQTNLDLKQSVEQPSSDQFETSDQLKQEAEQNAKQLKGVVVETIPTKPEPIEGTKTEKKLPLAEIFFNPEVEKRMQEIKIELGEEKEAIRTLEQELAKRKQKVKSLEGEVDKLEQDSLVAFFRNAPKIETANKRGATAVTRGMAISELHAALEKYDKTQDQSFIEKIMKKLSAKMKKLFQRAYPELFPKKEKPEKVKKLAKIKNAKSAIRGKGLVGGEGMSVA